MNLLEILKQFKNIQPDPAFTETSKRAILAQDPLGAAAPRGWSAQRTIWKIVEVSAAVVLTGFFVLLLTGSLLGNELAPVQYSAIDPQGLRAEAQAIDIQIQLANLNYNESSAQSTAQIAGGTKAAGRMPPAATAAPAAANGSGTASSTASSTLSIDQVLQGLSQ